MKLTKKLKEWHDKRKEPGYEKTRQLSSLINLAKRKRKLHAHKLSSTYGQICVQITEARALVTRRPYLILECCGNEHRTDTMQNSSPVFGDDAVHGFDFSDLDHDLVVLLYDDSALHNQQCIGRIVVPLTMLCTHTGVKPVQDLWFKFLPPHVAGNRYLEKRYTEAVKGYPGTGLLRPATPIGFLHMQLKLELTSGNDFCGLISTYCFSHKILDRKNEEEEEDELGEWKIGSDTTQQQRVESELERLLDLGTRERFQSKIVKQNIQRLKRILHKPYILNGWCGLLPCVMVHYFASFYAEWWQLPLCFLLLLLINSALAYTNISDMTDEMIFWEDGIGPDRRSKGIQKLINALRYASIFQQLLVKTVRTVEKINNMFNGTDLVITFLTLASVAAVCVVLSVLLAYVPLTYLYWWLGLALLLPALINVAIKTARTQKERAKSAEQLVSGSSDNSSEATATDKAGEHSPPSKQHKPRLPVPVPSTVNIVLKHLFNLISHLPDASDLAHRHVSAQQIVDKEKVPRRPPPPSTSTANNKPKKT